MDTVADIVAAASDREGLAFDAPSRSTGHSYGEFVTSVWKAGNLLRHYGARSGARVAVVVGPKSPDADDRIGRLCDAVEPLLAALGTQTVGGIVVFDPDDAPDGVALVAPSAWLSRYDAEPGCSPLAYGDTPSDPSVAHFERECWSENPVKPPESVEPGAPAILEGNDVVTQSDLVSEALRVASTGAIVEGERVAIDAPLHAPTFAVGVLATLLAGGTIVGENPDDADVVVGPDGTVDTDATSS